VTVDDLKAHFHQILYATGAQTDRQMGIPGEDLAGSHPATEFVAWYNGHPDYQELRFDLDSERVAVIGVGNVAIDVARILCRTPEELRATDMADVAVEALSKSRVRDVYLLGRRGPAQAAFTTPEIKEVGEMPGADVVVRPDEAALDALSRQEVEESGDRELKRKVDILEEYSKRQPSGKTRRLHVRFLVSPVEIAGDSGGHVASMKLAKNALVRREDGSIAPSPTGETETLDVGLVFRSVGYRGVALPGVPFVEKTGVIPNAKGRVIDPATPGSPRRGEYVTGWIKRGPSGVIGTNKPDSVETATAMIEDASQGDVLAPSRPSAAAFDALVRERQPRFFSFADWRRIDEIELARGKESNRPRVKFTSRDEMLAALGK
jgi:ferredoxin--NADP+ reductase